MDTKRVTPEVESGGRVEVINQGGGHFKVLSKSRPGRYRYVDLSRNACSCPATVEVCRHKRLARAADEMRPTFEIVRAHDSRRGGMVYRLVEVIAGERTEVSADLANYSEAWMFREELIAEVS